MPEQVNPANRNRNVIKRFLASPTDSTASMPVEPCLYCELP